MNGNPRPFLFTCLVLRLFVSSRGDVVFSDDFSYRDGPLVTVSDGRWKTHSGTTGQVEVAAGKLLLSQRKSEDVHAPFPGGPIGPIQALTLYASFSVNFSALPTGSTGSYFAHWKDATATTGLRGRIFATTNGAAPGELRLGIAAGANTPTAMLPQDLALHTEYRVVCRMRLTDNTSTLWLNPAAETDPGATSTDETTPKTAAAFAFRESLASGVGMGELAVDDLIVATTFAEVIPSVLRLRITRGGSGLHLYWAADRDKEYSVWAVPSPAEEFLIIAAGLSFSDGFGEFQEEASEAPAQFYRVSSP